MPRLRSNLVDFAFEEILKKINSYDLASNDIVSEVALAEELKISRTPIREAMAKLIDLGILERTATKVVVKVINYADIKELLQVREAIEVMSVKLIIQNGGLTDSEKAEIEEVSKSLSESISKGDLEKNFEQDYNFHKLLVEYSKNSRLIDICNRVNLQSQRFRWITMLTPARYSNTNEEHLAIIDALLSCNTSNATDAIVLHIKNSIDNYRFVLKDDKWIKVMGEFKNMHRGKGIQ